MKKLLGLILLFVTLSSSLFAAYPKWPEIQSPPGASWLWDATNSVWRPVSGTASGVPDAESAGTSSQTVVLLTSTPYSIPALADRIAISLSATGTFLFTTGSTTTILNTTPCYNAAWEDTDSETISVVGTDTYLTIRQWGQ